MKKTLLSFVLAMAMVMSMPAAIFASDTLVDANGDPAVSAKKSDGWAPATVFNLIEDAMLTEMAKTDSSIVIDDEKNGPSANTDEPIASPDMRTVSVDEVMADEGIEIAPMSVVTSSINASRYSNTSGNVGAYASFTKKASKATCSITLQEKYNGSWRTATGLSVRAYVKTVYNTTSIGASKTFTLKSGKVYRAKITFSDTNSSGTYYKIRYTGSF